MGAWDGMWFMVCCFVDFGGVSSALPEFIVVVYPVFIVVVSLLSLCLSLWCTLC